jgi:O-antigen/teichoic acid export membrane protein
LGYYTRAHQFTDFPSTNISGIIQRVTYPILCSIQDEDGRLSNIYRKFLRLSAFIAFPVMIGLAAVSKPLVLTLLNEEWLFTATLLSIICFSMMWYPVHSINLNLLQVKGRSDLFLKLEIYKKIVGIIILCITIPMGLIAMCIGSFFSSMIALVINTYYTGKLIGVGFIRQMCDLLPTFILSVSMGAFVYLIINILSIHPIAQLVIGIAIGILYYVLLALLFKFSEFKELLQLLKRK